MRYFLGVLHYKHIPPYPPSLPSPCFLHTNDSHCVHTNDSHLHMSQGACSVSMVLRMLLIHNILCLMGSCDTIYSHVSPHIFWHSVCYTRAHVIPYIHWAQLLFVCNTVVFMPIVSFSGILIALPSLLAVEYSSLCMRLRHLSTLHAIVRSLQNHALTLSGIAGTVLAYVYSSRLVLLALVESGQQAHTQGFRVASC